MPSRTYFLDASALIHKYSKLTDADSKRVRRRLAALFAANVSTKNRGALQTPSICMAECAKVFAKLAFQARAYGEGEKAVEAYERLREALLRDVSGDRIINSYELKRAHYVNIEEIFRLDYELPGPRGFGGYLSSHDALIISMATEFANKQHNSVRDVTIVTCDKRIAEFCSHYADDYATAVCVHDRDIV